MDTYLETCRLILRPFTLDDLDNLVDLNADPAVTFYINGGRPIPRDEVEQFLANNVGNNEPGNVYGCWAAIERASGQFIGWFHLRPHPGDPPDQPELGYRLKRSAWGNGYATEGSRALIQRAFEDLGTRRIVANTMTVNGASRRVMEKCGLTLVRTFFQEWPDRIPGDEYGDVEYALDRSDWERQRCSERPRQPG